MSGKIGTYNHADGRASKKDSLVGKPLSECCGTIDSHFIDQCNVQQKLMTLKALHIAQKNPLLKARNEYHSRELTLKY